ncbi:hypothetical protein ABTF11_17330, partial [Acinetobacter baumannii]
SYPSCNLNFSNLGKLYLQRLYATKPVNDAMEMGNISSFNAIMYNSVQHTKANLDMKMDLPLRNVHP